MLGVKNAFPPHSLPVVPGSSAAELSKITTAHGLAGVWKAFIFFPNEVPTLNNDDLHACRNLYRDFLDRDCELCGVVAFPDINQTFGSLPIPIFIDLNQTLCLAVGVLDTEEGVLQRATYVIDPNGNIRHVAVNDLALVKNLEETLRVLDALQTDELCPCNTQNGDLRSAMRS